MSRPHTPKEMRERFLNYTRAIVDYWEREGGLSERDRMEGLVFSMLIMLDGEAVGIPAFNLVPAPHPLDREEHRLLDENWWPDDGTPMNSGVALHEEWCARNKK